MQAWNTDALSSSERDGDRVLSPLAVANPRASFVVCCRRLSPCAQYLSLQVSELPPAPSADLQRCAKARSSGAALEASTNS